ncbi:hypothetical protein RhiirC2_790781 [Rhizophagus irregularis]|uniref:Uncharacterized protein n=1 Tax=Rhizophagus irregularis TaxID=588596 RepID=A0A2N1MKN1_9GLOM|nr:hypothetical protein RhiirC2_790781 [Rhizophagus irregularis]
MSFKINFSYFHIIYPNLKQILLHEWPKIINNLIPNYHNQFFTRETSNHEKFLDFHMQLQINKIPKDQAETEIEAVEGEKWMDNENINKWAEGEIVEDRG